jgi:aldehyde:ferredoxin oxidoreductase
MHSVEGNSVETQYIVNTWYTEAWPKKSSWWWTKLHLQEIHEIWHKLMKKFIIQHRENCYIKINVRCTNYPQLDQNTHILSLDSFRILQINIKIYELKKLYTQHNNCGMLNLLLPQAFQFVFPWSPTWVWNIISHIKGRPQS